MQTESPGSKAIAAMWRGILWIGFAIGAMLFMSLKASNGQTYYFVWGLISPRYFIGTFVALGLFEMIGGYARARRLAGPLEKPRLRASAALCLAVLAIAAIAGGAAWQHGAPLWSAVEDLSRGDDAAAKLRTIAERHAAKMEAGVAGPAAVQSWKESAEGALPLRADFDSAAQAARYLETAATGSLKVRAGIDRQFYAICLEWLDLYASIARNLSEESMIDPPDEWATRQNEFVDRIEALPPLPKEGS